MIKDINEGNVTSATTSVGMAMLAATLSDGAFQTVVRFVSAGEPAASE